MTDIREALEEAFGEEDKEQNTPVENISTEPQPKEEAPATLVENKETTPEEPKPVEPPPVERKAPSSWKKEAQEAFLKADRGEPLTPDEIKLLTKEAERREADFHKGISEFQSHSQRAKQYDQAFAPYQEYLKNIGTDAPTAIQHLLNAEVKLRTGDPVTKANYLRQLASDYNIDLGLVSEPVQLDPQIKYVMDELNSLRQERQLWQNQVEQQKQLAANQELSQFTVEGKEHFEAVRNDMADLLETGKAKDLQEAYEMAIWMRQDIRQTLIETQRQEAERKLQQEFQANKAKTAAVSVRGSGPMGAGGETLKGSLREILEAQMGKLY